MGRLTLITDYMKLNLFMINNENLSWTSLLWFQFGWSKKVRLRRDSTAVRRCQHWKVLRLSCPVRVRCHTYISKRTWINISTRISYAPTLPKYIWINKTFLVSLLSSCISTPTNQLNHLFLFVWTLHLLRSCIGEKSQVTVTRWSQRKLV